MINVSKEVLPILGFNYGYITYESQKAQITIGPMECTKKYTGTYVHTSYSGVSQNQENLYPAHDLK